MRKITKYKAEDGEIFDTPNECQAYEDETKINNILMNELNIFQGDVNEIKDVIENNIKLFHRYCCRELAKGGKGGN